MVSYQEGGNNMISVKIKPGEKEKFFLLRQHFAEVESESGKKAILSAPVATAGMYVEFPDGCVVELNVQAFLALAFAAHDQLVKEAANETNN